MISSNDINGLYNADVYGTDGSKIGSVAQVYLDDQTGAPEWVSVNTGLFGTKESFVPLSAATFTGERIEVPFDKARVKDAPQIDADGDLSPTEEDHLYSYYGLASTDGRLSGDTTRGGYDTTTTRQSGYDTSGRSTDDAMTRSEEQLKVSTETEQVGKARLRKHVITEQQQVTVPVTREEVRLEREPITEANRGDAYAGADITESEHEVTLHAERPVVDTEVVPVERVRLNKETVTEQQSVTGEVRKEQIEFDDDTTTGRKRR